MFANSKKICRLANRVELSANFVGSAAEIAASQKSFQEAVSTSIELLSEIDAFVLQGLLERATRDLVPQLEQLNVKPNWSEFLATQTDLMHQIGIHQKAIQRLGTLANQWDRSTVDYLSLVDALSRLADILTWPEERLFHALHGDQFQPNHIFKVPNVFYGLTLMLATAESGFSNSLWNASVVCSSAKLSADSAEAFCALCQ